MDKYTEIQVAIAAAIAVTFFAVLGVIILHAIIDGAEHRRRRRKAVLPEKLP